MGELAKPDHRYHELLEAVRDRVAGACGYRAQAYGAEQDIHREQIALLDEYEHHRACVGWWPRASRSSPSSRPGGTVRSPPPGRDGENSTVDPASKGRWDGPARASGRGPETTRGSASASRIWMSA
jgi:hypothetical protein